MGRVFLIVVLGGLVILAAAMLGLAEFPPHPRTQTVQTVVPNDRFQTHSP